MLPWGERKLIELQAELKCAKERNAQLEKQNEDLLRSSSKRKEDCILDLAGLNSQTIRSSIDWEKSVLGQMSKQGMAVDIVVCVVRAALKEYRTRRDLQSFTDAINEDMSRFYPRASWSVEAGFGFMRTACGVGASFVLNFEFRTKNFRVRISAKQNIAAIPNMSLQRYENNNNLWNANPNSEVHEMKSKSWRWRNLKAWFLCATLVRSAVPKRRRALWIVWSIVCSVQLLRSYSGEQYVKVACAIIAT